MARRAPKRTREGVVKGEATRRAIISRALKIASAEGLAALSIGRLARDLKMSKSGLFAHFRSKRTLELATIDRAREVFANEVLLPPEDSPEGIERLWNLCHRWLQHVEQRTFPGGYFFTGAFFECAQQDGSTPKRVTEITHEWFDALRRAVDGARMRGEIRMTVDAKRAAIELNSVLLGTQWAYLLGHRDFRQARSAILAKLGSLATERIPSSAFDSVRDWRRYLESRRE